MTLVSRNTGSISLLALVVLIASTACAQTPQPRHHAVTPPPAPVGGPTTQVIGVVKDASNGVPVQLATASSGDQSSPTNANGEFFLNLPTGVPVTVTVLHPGFLPFQKAITPQAGGRYDFALTEQPSVTVKLTSGVTYIVDIGSAQFAYALPLSSYVTSANENFCKPDGSAFTPTKFEFTKIIGPATESPLPVCCDGGLLAATAQFKSGETTQVFFKDSCHFTEIDFGGRDKATGLYRWAKFTDVAEIDFP
ncbi:MAG TPA: carboxypeptidase-like regulatory domain-containing protein [Thermoanaerobaculia bacterium]|nr:carboxypeptidase-like regulatory domain-containing protein [Thermoanaerobaculia bacterium]